MTLLMSNSLMERCSRLGSPNIVPSVQNMLGWYLVMCRILARAVSKSFGSNFRIGIIQRLLDLSRFRSGQVLMLSGLPFESHGAFPAQG